MTNALGVTNRQWPARDPETPPQISSNHSSTLQDHDAPALIYRERVFQLYLDTLE